MNFGQPQFLWALFLLAIPIAIHLFSLRRYKTVYFSSIRFLKEVKEQTQKQSQLKHLLLLISRLLALFCIILAFAQPFIPFDSASYKAASNPFIFLDNSYSMMLQYDKGYLLETSKDLAFNLAEAHAIEEEMFFGSQLFSGSDLRSKNKSEVKEEIANLNFSSTAHDLEEVFSRYKNTKAKNRTNYIISDFQKNIIPEELKSIDSSITVFAFMVQPEKTHNISLDSISISSPYVRVNEPFELKINVSNLHSSTDLNTTVFVRVNKQIVEEFTTSVKLGTSLDTTISITVKDTGWLPVEVSVNDQPYDVDNVIYGSVQVKSSIRILELKGKNATRYPELAYEQDSIFEFISKKPEELAISEISSFDAFLFNEVESLSSALLQEFKNQVLQGRNMLIIPPGNPSEKLLQALIPARKSVSVFQKPKPEVLYRLNTKHPFFSNVFESFPEQLLEDSLNIILKVSTLPQEVLVSTKTNLAYLSVFNSGNGSVFLYTAPLSSNKSLSKFQLFLPTLFEVAFQSSNKTPLSYWAGSPILLSKQLQKSETPPQIIHQSSGKRFIPKVATFNNRSQLIIRSDELEPGIYSLIDNNELLALIGLNFSRKESQFEYLNEDQLSNWFKQQGIENIHVLPTSLQDIKSDFKQMSQGTQLWKYFIALGILFLGIEIFLTRILKS